MKWDRPPVTVDRVYEDAPLVIRIDQPGCNSPWLMSPKYAREMAMMLIGAALTVEMEQEITQWKYIGD